VCGHPWQGVEARITAGLVCQRRPRCSCTACHASTLWECRRARASCISGHSRTAGCRAGESGGASVRDRRRSRRGRYRWPCRHARDVRASMVAVEPSSGEAERGDWARPWGTAGWSPRTPAGDVPSRRAARRPARSAEQLPEHLGLAVRLLRLARPALRLRRLVVGPRVRGQLPDDRGALIQRAHRRP
jgi:hypothetical protein